MHLFQSLQISSKRCRAEIVQACCQWALLDVRITTLLFTFTVQKYIYLDFKQSINQSINPCNSVSIKVHAGFFLCFCKLPNSDMGYMNYLRVNVKLGTVLLSLNVSWFNIYPWRWNMAAQVAEELKMVTYATPPMEERRRRRRRRFSMEERRWRTWRFSICSSRSK